MRAVNLIPGDQRSGGSVGSRSEGAAFAVLALLAGIAVLVFMYGSAQHQVSSRHAEAAALTNEAQQLQSQASRLASYTSFVAMREQRIQAISTLVGSRFDWSNAMGELSRVLPRFVSLSSLQGTVGSTAGTPGVCHQHEHRLCFKQRRQLRDASRHRPHLHAHRVRRQPGGGR
jgi:Tfp pilus assembly protein PilN